MSSWGNKPADGHRVAVRQEAFLLVGGSVVELDRYRSVAGRMIDSIRRQLESDGSSSCHNDPF